MRWAGCGVLHCAALHTACAALHCAALSHSAPACDTRHTAASATTPASPLTRCAACPHSLATLARGSVLGQLQQRANNLCWPNLHHNSGMGLLCGEL